MTALHLAGQIVLLGRRSLEDVHVTGGVTPAGQQMTVCGLLITAEDTIPTQRTIKSRKEPYRTGCQRCTRHVQRLRIAQERVRSRAGSSAEATA